MSKSVAVRPNFGPAVAHILRTSKVLLGRSTAPFQLYEASAPVVRRCGGGHRSLTHEPTTILRACIHQSSLICQSYMVGKQNWWPIGISLISLTIDCCFLSRRCRSHMQRTNPPCRAWQGRQLMRRTDKEYSRPRSRPGGQKALLRAIRRVVEWGTYADYFLIVVQQGTNAKDDIA
jgi:hypothetical protein